MSLGMTLSLRPKDMFWSNGSLRLGRLVSFQQMYMKPTLGYFSVPELETTKEKVEVWNIGIFLVDLILGLSFEGSPRGQPASRILDLLPRTRLTQLPGCGHVPQQECPAAFVEALQKLLGGPPPEAAPATVPPSPSGSAVAP